METTIQELLANMSVNYTNAFTGVAFEVPEAQGLRCRSDDSGDCDEAWPLDGVYNPAWDVYREEDDTREERAEEAADYCMNNCLQATFEENHNYGDFLGDVEVDARLWEYVVVEATMPIQGRVTVDTKVTDQSGLETYLRELMGDHEPVAKRQRTCQELRADVQAAELE